jgi:hypothetical protein
MEKFKELLIMSFDTKLTAEEQQQLEEALVSFPELRKEKKEIEDMRVLLSDFTPAFKENFAKGVLGAIEDISQAGDNLFYLFKRFAFGSAAAIVALLISVYLTDGTISVDTLFGLSDITSDSILLALSNF